jgi:hypothetical protein
MVHVNKQKTEVLALGLGISTLARRASRNEATKAV